MEGILQGEDRERGFQQDSQGRPKLKITFNRNLTFEKSSGLGIVVVYHILGYE